jgi:hypothetical protein
MIHEDVQPEESRNQGSHPSHAGPRFMGVHVSQRDTGIGGNMLRNRCSWHLSFGRCTLQGPGRARGWEDDACGRLLVRPNAYAGRARCTPSWRRGGCGRRMPIRIREHCTPHTRAVGVCGLGRTETFFVREIEKPKTGRWKCHSEITHSAMHAPGHFLASPTGTRRAIFEI